MRAGCGLARNHVLRVAAERAVEQHALVGRAVVVREHLRGRGAAGASQFLRGWRGGGGGVATTDALETAAAWPGPPTELRAESEASKDYWRVRRAVKEAVVKPAIWLSVDGDFERDVRVRWLLWL